MKAETKRCNLLEITYKSNSRTEFERIMWEYVTLFKKLTSEDSDPYYTWLTRFYNITFDGDDFLKAFSSQNNKKYVRYEELSTDMIISQNKKDGFGNGITWSSKKEKIKLVAAVVDNIRKDDESKANPNRDYTKAEINRLLLNKDIVIVGVNRKEVPKETIVNEEYEPFPVVEVNGTECEFFKNNLPLFGKILREEISQEQILEDIASFMKELDYQLNTVTIFNQGMYHEINEECKKWWINSSLKNEYESIKEEIANKIKKNKR